MEEYIKVRGARQHNLKNIDVDIPKNKLVVFTGVSGSGKSSLAFDTIYAEGQRRYVESLSSYARQFLGIMDKPDVDKIVGLSPAISIDQKTTSHNPRSTVATVTEIYDYLRLLFARIGHPHCPICGREIAHQTLDQISEAIQKLITIETAKSGKSTFFLFSPLVAGKKGEYSGLLDNLLAKGFRYVKIDNLVKDLNDEIVLIKTNKHSIDVVIDKFAVNKKNLKDQIFVSQFKQRLSESLETALKISGGNVILSTVRDKTLEIPEFPQVLEDNLFSEKFACPVDNIQLAEIEPRSFSFNSPYGACIKCSGLGKILKVEPALIFSPEISIKEGGILPFSNMFENDTWYSRLLETLCLQENINLKTPIKNLTPRDLKILLEGTGAREYKVFGKNRFGNETVIYERFSGVVSELTRRHSESQSEFVRSEITKYMKEDVCSECSGARLKKEVLSITIDTKSIADVAAFSVKNCLQWIKKIAIQNVLTLREKEIGNLILNEIANRIKFLESVGLSYLTLDRAAQTLAGGEAQRIRLASQIGSGLTGVLYILDEPTIGLHPKDNEMLIATLKTLRDLGNSVIIVEHDKDMMFSSDYIIDFGPEAGKLGGRVIFSGTPSKIISSSNSLTGKYLSGSKKIVLDKSKDSDNKFLTIKGCIHNNLKNIDVQIPLGKLVVITGVSGSGKSSLLVDTLYHAISQKLNPYYKEIPGAFKSIEGIEDLKKMVLIDQSPIGRTPRSNPATYTKLFDSVRDAFSLTREAKLRGFKKGRFSFNVKGGRCETCEGQGQIKIEMQFMPDIWIDCEVCHGKRYNSQTLEVNLYGKNISEVLALTISEAREFFHLYPKIISKLDTLSEVGLGYMELGQSATTLSGGEAQRVKLASELSKTGSGGTLYVLDEPTTGLHFADLEKLLKVLYSLVMKGNTVVTIEHNLDVIKNADWIIDLGPEGGDMGGEIIAQGTPIDIMKNPKSQTGKFLKFYK